MEKKKENKEEKQKVDKEALKRSVNIKNKQLKDHKIVRKDEQA
jgi:hypothetical protein